MLNTAHIIASKALSTPIGNNFVTLRDDLLIARRGPNITVVFDPFQWTRNLIGTFPERALLAALIDVDDPRLFGRAFVRLSLTRTRPVLASYGVATRVVSELRRDRTPRVDIDLRQAVSIASPHGSGLNRMFRATEPAA